MSMQRETDKPTVKAADFSTCVLVTDTSIEQKNVLDLNSIINELNITDIYKTFILTAAESTFFLSAHGNFYQDGPYLDP